MDRNTAFFSAAIGVGLALRYGPGFGQSLYGIAPNAGLQGMAWVGGGSAFAAYVALNRLRYDYVVAGGFAVLVAWYYGQQVGYQVFFAHDDLQAMIYGCSITFLAAMIPGELFVWPVVRQAGNAVITAMDKAFDGLPRLGSTGEAGLLTSLRAKPPASCGTPEQLWESIENGETLEYKGRVDRDFTYFDVRNRKIRLRMKYVLRRDTLAMQPRERAALYILRMVQRHGLATDTLDRHNFALTYGNGACSIWWDSFTSDPRVLQPLGFKTGDDVIRHEAAAKGASVDASISELLALLRQRATAKNAPEELMKLHQGFINPAPQPGGGHGQWS